MFFILTLALLPLGLVALFASLQAIRTADTERQSLLEIAAMQSARKLSAEIQSDQTALRIATNAFARGLADPQQCARLDSFIRSRTSQDTHFAIYDRAGRVKCSTGDGATNRFAPSGRFESKTLELLPDSSMLLARTPSDDRQMVALAFYGRDYLDRVTDPATAMASHRVVLRQGNRSLTLEHGKPFAAGGRIDQVTAPIEGSDVTLNLIVRTPPQTLARSLSLFLPLVMWFAAAAIGWFVVNRLLIRPLVLLRRTVAAYQPGVPLQPLQPVRTPAQEIVDLGETFREISEDVATHEAEMAEGLARQRKLTREVHHRVKNNLQIIASLINLHSRSAETVEAAEAYGSIQRRVDALSVVHRNHYAELEENRGVGIRALVGELSASLRASAPDNGARLAIQVESADLYVTQDVAVPIAFLVTELVELAMLCDPATMIQISILPVSDADGARAQVMVTSAALRTTPVLQERLVGRFDRVLTGLSRQLRAPLVRDEAEGRFAIAVPVLDGSALKGG
ncbi:sensor histidine kinase [Sphingobium algorifonticola]|uniref:histidine kinase n=1 Tax=Sphingobium algorifonticola TaxID=2008318 RepID=A0A437J9R1_9SPHN|nr:sensor histidine kinase [Sphingobium algorifonticola]RVT42123.1 sensor histidine kinase [Sphingobium algorifonticola]